MASARTGSSRWASRLVGFLIGLGVIAWTAVFLAVELAQLPAAPSDGGAPLPAATAAALGGAGSAPTSLATAPSASAWAPSASAAGAWAPSVSPEVLPAPSASPGVAAEPPRVPVAFGMSGHLMWHDIPTAVHELDMLQQDGLTAVRFDVSWRSLEPWPGRYAWLGKLDRIVNAAVARRIRPVLTIIETPGWANRGQDAWVPPDDPADYAAFAGMLARRYAGRVDAWEVWNEPDIPLFWRPSPDPAAYARLLLAASAAIRSANPHAIVVGGSVTFGNVGYLRALYQHGAHGAFDVLSVHPYTLTQAPGDVRDRYHSLTAILDDMRAVMVANGDAATPIWVTELGWAVVGINSVSPAARVRYLAETVPIILARPWVQLLAIYTIDTADSARYGLSSNGRRSSAWVSYVRAVAKATAH